MQLSQNLIDEPRSEEILIYHITDVENLPSILAADGCTQTQ